MAGGDDSGDRGEEAKKPTRSLSVCAPSESHTTSILSPSALQELRRSSSLRGVSDAGPWRRRSLSNLSRDTSRRSFEGVPGEVTAQVGDSGGRTYDGSHRESWRKGSIRLSHDIEAGAKEDDEDRFAAKIGDSGDLVVGENAEEGLLEEQETVAVFENGTVSIEEKISTLLVQPVQRYTLPRPADYASYLLHMAVFGILGVFARHLLQKLFGPGRLALTRDGTPLYLDLPANMVGSFFMGWFGLVFKGDVRHVSDHLAVGVTTGFMGSLTTFSGWNQKMLDLSSQDHWVFAVAGIVFGFFLVNESFNYGVISAEYLRGRLVSESPEALTFVPERWAVRRYRHHATAMATALLLLGLLWAVSASLTWVTMDGETEGAVLWLACLVGPPGVWLRWYLARFNGRGPIKWLPAGTLAANFLAAVAMAALSTAAKEVVSTRARLIINGIEFGFMGCLSTVSTFAAEVYAMRQGGHEGRAVAYAAATFLSSFAVGTLVYSIPAWTRHYD